MQEEVIAEAPAEEVIPESAAQPTETTAESEQETKPESKEKDFTQEELDSIVQKRLAKESRRIAKLAEVEAENRMLKQQMEQARPETRGTVRKSPYLRSFRITKAISKRLPSGKQTRNLQRSEPNRKRNSANVKHRNAQTRYSKNSAAQRRNMRISRKVAPDPSVPITQHGRSHCRFGHGW